MHQIGEQLPCLPCRFIPLTPLSPGLLREKGMDCGKIKEEEPSPALEGGGVGDFSPPWSSWEDLVEPREGFY